VSLSPSAGAPDGERVVAFSLGGQLFGAPIAQVKETLSARPVTPLFLMPALVAGLINLRGEVVAVLDLEQLLGLELGGRPSQPPIVILRHKEGRGDKAAAGLLVERLQGVMTIASGAVQPPPATLGAEPASYLRGVATAGDPPRPLLLLDPERVLETERLRPFRRVGATRGNG
jgi:purine-binding chemotaxis protein CheW